MYQLFGRLTAMNIAMVAGLGLLMPTIGSAKAPLTSKKTWDQKPLPFTYEKVMSDKVKSSFPDIEAQTDKIELRNSPAGTAKLTLTKNPKGQLTLVTLLMMNRPNRTSPNWDATAYLFEAVADSLIDGSDFFEICQKQLAFKKEFSKQYSGFKITCSGSFATMRVAVEAN